jgi:hypothetical protein
MFRAQEWLNGPSAVSFHEKKVSALSSVLVGLAGLAFECVILGVEES